MYSECYLQHYCCVDVRYRFVPLSVAAPQKYDAYVLIFTTHYRLFATSPERLEEIRCSPERSGEA